MSFPNPPGYYSLQMPESVEIEIKELGYFELTETLNDITYAITPQGDDPAFEYLSSEADAYFALLVIEITSITAGQISRYYYANMFTRAGRVDSKSKLLRALTIEV